MGIGMVAIVARERVDDLRAADPENRPTCIGEVAEEPRSGSMSCGRSGGERIRRGTASDCRAGLWQRLQPTSPRCRRQQPLDGEVVAVVSTDSDAHACSSGRR